MRFDTALLGLLILAATNIAVIAAAWGDMRRQVKNNRERQDERHEENQEVMHEIREDTKRINGQVARHQQVLLTHGEEINRLRVANEADFHHYHHEDRAALRVLDQIHREVHRMALDLTKLKADVQGLTEDVATLKGASDRAEVSMDAIKAKLDALIAAGDGASQAEIETIAAAVEAASATLKSEASDLNSASDRDNPPTVALAAGKVGEAYSASLDIVDVNAVSCVIQSGSVPPGLGIDLETLSGTPTAAGSFSFVVWHIDAQSIHVGPATEYTVSIAQ